MTQQPHTYTVIVQDTITGEQYAKSIRSASPGDAEKAIGAGLGSTSRYSLVGATENCHRTFLPADQQARDEYVVTRMGDDCQGCVSDGDQWTPAEACPVHGQDNAWWWDDLNATMDERWPGTWYAGPPRQLFTRDAQGAA